MPPIEIWSGISKRSKSTALDTTSPDRATACTMPMGIDGAR